MKRVLIVVTALIISSWAPAAFADSPLKSNSYEVDESFIGGGGLVTENSANYRAGESIGDVGTGTSSSTNFQTNSGYTTTNDPALSFIVNTSSMNFGALTSTATATATMSFSAIYYTSYGYSVLIYGNPPSNGSHTLTAMSTTAASQTGTEQFGLNLRGNTSPIAFGADPSGGYGTFSTGYGTINQYTYTSGSTIATSAKSSGVTNFTGSYIINTSVSTAGGTYTGTQTLICVGTY